MYHLVTNLPVHMDTSVEILVTHSDTGIYTPVMNPEEFTCGGWVELEDHRDAES